MFSLPGFTTLLIVVVWLGPAIVAGLAIRYRARLRAETTGESHAGYAPRASVIVPCKGSDIDFEGNVMALLRQDYADYEVIFVTEDRDDPAYACLERIVAQAPERARVTIAGMAESRSQKVHNQLAALQIAGLASEVYAFVDSDGRPGPHFLQRLIAPLSEEGVGAATGYRWFVPARRGTLEIMAALWGAIVASVQAEPQFAQMWGGAMAIRRQTFEDLNVRQVWAGASTDDDSLTRTLRERGLGIVFVPQCFVLSSVRFSLSRFMAWGSRQLLLTRVYLPQMWWQLFILAAISALAPPAGLVLAGVGLFATPKALAPGLALAATAAVPVVSTALITRNTERFLAALGHQIEPLAKWDFLIAVPGSLLLLAHFILSGLTRRVEWRGVTYELLAPGRTVILKRSRRAIR